jgi:hypothetical protein
MRTRNLMIGLSAIAIVSACLLMGQSVFPPAGGGGSIAATSSVLKGNGSGGAVAASAGTDFIAPGAAGLNLIEQHTASSSASLDFTTCFTSTYDEYQIEMVNLVPATDNVNAIMRFSTDGGSSYDSGNNYQTAAYRFVFNSAGAGGGTAQSSLGIDGGGGVDALDNSTSYGLVGSYKVYSPLSASLYKRVIGQVSMQTNGNSLMSAVYVGSYESATAVNAFRVLMSSGNIASGTVRCYGVAK